MRKETKKREATGRNNGTVIQTMERKEDKRRDQTKRENMREQ
jgi:hypothetical protein